MIANTTNPYANNNSAMPLSMIDMFRNLFNTGIKTQNQTNVPGIGTVGFIQGIPQQRSIQQTPPDLLAQLLQNPPQNIQTPALQPAPTTNATVPTNIPVNNAIPAAPPNSFHNSSAASISYPVGPLNTNIMDEQAMQNDEIRARNDRILGTYNQNAEGWKTDDIVAAQMHQSHLPSQYDKKGNIKNPIKTYEDAMKFEKKHGREAPIVGGIESISASLRPLPMDKASNYQRYVNLNDPLYKTISNYRSDSYQYLPKLKKLAKPGGKTKIVYGYYYMTDSKGSGAYGKTRTTTDILRELTAHKLGDNVLPSLATSFFRNPQANSNTHYTTDKFPKGYYGDIERTLWNDNPKVTGLSTPMKAVFFSNFKIDKDNKIIPVSNLSSSGMERAVAKLLKPAWVQLTPDEIQLFKNNKMIKSDGSPRPELAKYIKIGNGGYYMNKIVVDKSKLMQLSDPNDKKSPKVMNPRKLKLIYDFVKKSNRKVIDELFNKNNRNYLDNISYSTVDNKPISKSENRKYQRQTGTEINTIDVLNSIIYNVRTNY